MPRPPRLPARDQIADSELPDYDAGLDRARRMRADRPGEDIPPYFAALLNAPPVAAGLMELGRIVRTRGEQPDSYSHHDRELVDQVLAALWGTNVVQRTHVPDAIAVGVRPEAIAALHEGRDEDLTDDEREIADYVRAVAQGSVDDEAYARLVTRMGTRGAVDFTFFVGFLMATIRLHQALGMEDPPDAEIARLLDELASGRTPAPDYRVRIR